MRFRTFDGRHFALIQGDGESCGAAMHLSRQQRARASLALAMALVPVLPADVPAGQFGKHRGPVFRFQTVQNQSIFKNSASLKTLTPRSCALTSLEPASSPASTKLVLLLTLLVTLPPSASIFAFAASRVSVGSVPVSHLKTVLFVAACFSFWTPASNSEFSKVLSPSGF
jgi:hypothetical protein